MFHRGEVCKDQSISDFHKLDLVDNRHCLNNQTPQVLLKCNKSLSYTVVNKWSLLNLPILSQYSSPFPEKPSLHVQVMVLLGKVS